MSGLTEQKETTSSRASFDDGLTSHEPKWLVQLLKPGRHNCSQAPSLEAVSDVEVTRSGRPEKVPWFSPRGKLARNRRNKKPV